MTIAKPYRHAFAIFVLFLFAYVSYSLLDLLVFSPVTSKHNEIKKLRFQIERYQSIAKDNSVYAANLATLESEIEKENEFLAATEYSIASANLQAMIREMADQSGTPIISLQGSSEVQSGSLVEVAVRVSCQATTDSLRNFLYQIESQTPYLIVSELRLARRPQSRTTAPIGAPDINAQFVVVGFQRNKDMRS